MRTPPLLADFIQNRVCKLKCEKFLTRPKLLYCKTFSFPLILKRCIQKFQSHKHCQALPGTEITKFFQLLYRFSISHCRISSLPASDMGNTFSCSAVLFSRRYKPCHSCAKILLFSRSASLAFFITTFGVKTNRSMPELPENTLLFSARTELTFRYMISIL